MTLTLKILLFSLLFFGNYKTLFSQFYCPYIDSNGINYISLQNYLKTKNIGKVNALISSELIQGYAILGHYHFVDSLFSSSSKSIERIELNDSMVYNLSVLKKSIRSTRVLMLNEAHDRIETRAFVLSMLGFLWENGYRYLAMEALVKDDVSSISYINGHYLQEPVMGEIVRRAKLLGFKFIAYESLQDLTQSPQERDSIQAINLAGAVKKIDNKDKIVVLAGYSHNMDETPFTITMGKYFKQLTGIDPISVDITRGVNDNCIENFNIYYSNIDSITLVKNAIFDSLLQYTSFDYFLLLPKTKWKSDRPMWLSAFGYRKEKVVRIKQKPKPFLLQVFYRNEVTSDSSFNYVTPADQIFVEDKREVRFFLVPNNDYVIVYRDSLNKIFDKCEFRFN